MTTDGGRLCAWFSAADPNRALEVDRLPTDPRDGRLPLAVRVRLLPFRPPDVCWVVVVVVSVAGTVVGWLPCSAEASSIARVGAAPAATPRSVDGVEGTWTAAPSPPPTTVVSAEPETSNPAHDSSRSSAVPPVGGTVRGLAAGTSSVALYAGLAASVFVTIATIATLRPQPDEPGPLPSTGVWKSHTYEIGFRFNWHVCGSHQSVS
jgi:hypothetical protein